MVFTGTGIDSGWSWVPLDLGWEMGPENWGYLLLGGGSRTGGDKGQRIGWSDRYLGNFFLGNFFLGDRYLGRYFLGRYFLR
jgi:hypothetical protein